MDICSFLKLEQNLEEAREELQRATEAESSLRSQCACLEKEHAQKKEQIEVEPFIMVLISNSKNDGHTSVCQTNGTRSASTYLYF